MLVAGIVQDTFAGEGEGGEGVEVYGVPEFYTPNMVGYGVLRPSTPNKVC